MLQACEKRYGNNPREILAELLCICLKPKGCVYFIESVGVGHIKIGWTSGNPEQRLKALQTGSGCRLELIGSIAGEQHLETKLHQYFGHLRHNGEWFHGTNELREYIVKHAKLETANA